MIRTVLHVLAAAAWSVAVFLVGLHLFFPSEAALERIRWEVDQRSGGEWALEAAEASPWRLVGLSLSDVRILSIEKKRASRRSRIRTEEEEEPPEATAKPILSLDRLAARLRISSLLRRTPDIGFAADLYGGEVSGHARVSQDRTVLAFEVDDVDLARVPIGGKTWTVDAEGEVKMEVDLDLDPKDTRASEGSLKLWVNDLAIRSGNVAGMNLPENTTFTRASLAVDLKNGKGSVTEGVFASSLGEAEVDGDLTLNRKLTRSRLRLELTLTLQDTIDDLLQILPAARNARDDEGTYHFVISGTLLNPSIRGNHNRNVRPSRRIEGRMPGFEPGPQPEFGPGFGDQKAPDDDRRREREERLKERRERLKQRRDAEQRDRGMPEDALDGPRMRRPADWEDEEDLPPMEEPDDRMLPEYEEDERYPEEEPPYPEEGMEFPQWPEAQPPPMEEMDGMPPNGE
ncbi:MAG: type II secretion system protein GspN [Deltaproteobacteria bacterium]|nr:type II secretion system protein GspN [Deltaproteobacteria bacterium]